MFGGKPAFSKLSKKYTANTKKSMGNIVINHGKTLYYINNSSRYGFSSKTAKVECIRKIKGGYRVAIAHYMTKYYESGATSDMTYAHSLIDVKKNSKSAYKYVVKKVNCISYIKHD